MQPSALMSWSDRAALRVTASVVGERAANAEAAIGRLVDGMPWADARGAQSEALEAIDGTKRMFLDSFNLLHSDAVVTHIGVESASETAYRAATTGLYHARGIVEGLASRPGVAGGPVLDFPASTRATVMEHMRGAIGALARAQNAW